MPDMLNPGIFRGSDIRGEVGTDLTPAVAEILGRAFARYVRISGGRIAMVGRDNRPNSDVLAEAFLAGLHVEAMPAVDLGMVPTPVVYFAASTTDSAFGAMVTASHLGMRWNGIKFSAGPRSVHGTELTRIRDLADPAVQETPGRRTTDADGPTATPDSDAATDDAAPHRPTSRPDAILSAYLDRFARLRPAGALMRVVVDAQNGAASHLGPIAMEQLGCEVIRLHCDPGSPPPFDRPDPAVAANLVPLQALVRERGAQLGIAFDGDGDRVGIVDDRGRVVTGDLLLALLAADTLGREPGGRIVFDVLSSDVVREHIERNGGTAIRWKSGHAFVQDKMFEVHASLAGESSGHLFFADAYRDHTFGYDDGLYAGARIAELVARSAGGMSALVAALPRRITSPEYRPRVADDVKFVIVAEVARQLRAAGHAVSDVDGAGVDFGDGTWGLVRAANTEPALSMRFESGTQANLDRWRTDVLRRVVDAGAGLGVVLSVESILAAH